MSPEVVALPSWSDGILVPPSNGINLKKLAHDTSEALEALQPFYLKGSKCSIFSGNNREMASKMNAYAQAIKSSIQASGHGYTIATDAIGALNYILGIPAEELDPQDKVLIAYLQKTCDLASKGLTLAKKAQGEFRDVRKDLKRLIETEGQNPGNMDARAAALEKFRDTLSLYVNWWLVMEMNHEAQEGRSDLQLNVMRQRCVLDCWKQLQQDYVIYRIEIGELQDSNPDFFHQCPEVSEREYLPHVPPTPHRAPSPTVAGGHREPPGIYRSTLSEASSPTLSPSSSDESLVPPSNGIDLKKLANDTNDALEALERFYTQGNKWYMFFGRNNQIASKVKAYTEAYADAIDSSIEASGHGYTIATDAIDALNYILNIPTKALGPQDKVLKAYLQKTSDLTSDGLKLAEKALDDFQDVRKNLRRLIKTEEQSTENTAALEKFRDTLSLYVDWWVKMVMKHKVQRDKSDRPFNIFRHQGVLDDWKKLQKDYVIYNQQIGALEARL